ncbi:MAG TPA: glycosyl hydrolase family 79 C-terminal domain-containing protein, partial [Pseudacidobacterium sp.]|nr:glycosyl hydrolase family 79 C-terminal domain-containing protein [Pseudacidobacterium sp.]
TNWTTAILNAESSLGANVKVMGAAWGGVNYFLNNIAAYEQSESQYINLATQHVYGGYTESGQSFANDYLLTPSVATQTPHTLQPYVAPIHGLNQKFRVGEINSIDDGGIAGISDAFGAALWAIDTMFEYANAGLDGVNWHGTSGCTYCAFTFAVHNLGGIYVYPLQHVAPLYYGMYFFHQAAGNGAHLLPVTLNASGGTLPNIKIWSTIDSNNVVRVAIINKDESFAGNVMVSLSGYGAAQVTRLVAPSYTATSGVSIGGQTFDGSIDGNLVYSANGETNTPSNGVYSVPVQPTSAVLLTISQ